jgi:hypothetical protein
VQLNYAKLKDIFVGLASSSVFPNITWIDFGSFCTKCDIFDSRVTLAAIDRLFIVTNFEVVDNADNPDRALCRYELFEILVRIANLKYRETGQAQTYAEAFEKMLEWNIMGKYDMPCAWQAFRDQELWTMDVNDTMEANLGALT